MHLAPLPPAAGTVLAHLPLALAPRIFTPVLSASRWRGPPARRKGTWMLTVFCRRHRVEVSGTGQSRPAIFSRLPTSPIACRKARPKSTLMARQNWMAASEKVSGRPGRPRFRGRPLHLAIDPGQQRAPPAKGGVVLGPVRHAVAGRRRLAHGRPDNPADTLREPLRSGATQQRREWMPISEPLG